MNHKPKRRIDLREIEREPSTSHAVEDNVKLENTNSSPIFELVPRRKGRIVRQPNMSRPGIAENRENIKFSYLTLISTVGGSEGSLPISLRSILPLGLWFMI